MDQPASPADAIRRDIEAAVASLEKLRGQVPDAQVEAMLSPLLERLAECSAAGDQTAGIDTGGGSAVQGSVQVRGGHFIGRDLIQHITRVVQGGEDAQEAKSVVARYLDSLASDLTGVQLGEIDGSIDQSRQERLQLADVYVPLDTGLAIPADACLDDWLASARGRGRRTESPGEPRETRPVAAVEALAAHRELTLIGKPGSGKSTFGASVLLALARAWQGRDGALEPLGPTWTHGPLLPIRVVLRRFAELLPPGEAPAHAGDLWAFIARDLEQRGHLISASAMGYLRRIVGTAGGLILLDGLDECGGRTRQGQVLAAVRELVATAGPRCRFLLTARPYDA